MLVAHGSSCSYPKPVTRRDCSTYKKRKKNKGTRRTKGNEEKLKNHALEDIYNLPC
jgi:hypothetical protein